MSFGLYMGSQFRPYLKGPYFFSQLRHSPNKKAPSSHSAEEKNFSEREETMKGSDSETSRKSGNNKDKSTKPPFIPAKDDTKPVLQDPILRSDPIETEEAVLRLPPFPIARSTNPSPK
ncbi:uncharacterized protein LOC126615638 [Malus sylvestris]|uniref:uncharacterized protein LOC126615638 n=1 Tax=Malus sylvestris TaxID=3752 RepID=UPI0021AC1F72|nr:uncharacterized protein LOC126615638 [Malus sylvestris]